MNKVLTALFVLVFVSGYSQSDDLRKKHFNTEKNIGAEGYDPVSYFDGRPQEGKPGLSTTYKGITYLFYSPSNLAKFKSSSEKYEPAYGGWCAYAMGKTGEKVKIDPETYKIVDGKLYLFYNFWGNNTLNDWNKNEKFLKDVANSNWAKTLK